MQKSRFVALAGAALVVVAGASACSETQTQATKAARVIISGNTLSTRAPTCGQQQMYRSIDIRDADSRIQAVVLLKADKVLPQWVKIHNFDGFNGSFWKNGVGDAQATLAQHKFTITGNAYGINSSNPNKVTTESFTIITEC